MDAAGARSSRYGSIGDQVDRLRVVFAQGDVADLGFEPWPGFEAEPADFKDLVVRKLQTLFRSCEKVGPPDAGGRAQSRWLRPRAGRRRRIGHPPRPAGGRLRGDVGGHPSGRAAHGSHPCGQGVVVLPFAGLFDAAAFVPSSSKRSSLLARATSSTAARSAWHATRIPRSATGSPMQPRPSSPLNSKATSPTRSPPKFAF